jgi:hypothetical protein
VSQYAILQSILCALYDGAILQPQHPPHTVRDLLLIMRDQHQRLFRLQLLIQEPVHFPDRLVVHAREGFVEDEQRRAFYERAEEEDQGLVPC